jgi:hypothetical protein
MRWFVLEGLLSQKVWGCCNLLEGIVIVGRQLRLLALDLSQQLRGKFSKGINDTRADSRHVGDSGQNRQTKMIGIGQTHWMAKGILATS